MTSYNELISQIREVGICEDLQEKDKSLYDNLIIYLRDNHKDDKLYNMKTLCIIKNKYNYKDVSLCVIKNDDTRDTISLMSKMKKSKAGFRLEVMRNEITDQIKEFRSIHCVCSVCDSITNIEIDHCGSNEFKDISKSFLEENPYTDSYTKIDLIWYFDNREYAEKWKKYHKEYSSLQALCYECHKDKTHRRC